MSQPCEWCMQVSSTIDSQDFQIETLEEENKKLRQEVLCLEGEVKAQRADLEIAYKEGFEDGKDAEKRSPSN